MAQYWLDFADDTVGNAPAGLTKRWTTTGLTLTVQEDGDAPSGKSVRVQKTALSRSAVTVDAVDSDADRDDCEIRALIRTPSSYSTDASSPIVYGLVRGSGASSAETAYCGGLDYTTSGPSRVASMRKYVSGTLTANIDTLTDNPAFSDSTKYWLRFKASGTTLERGLAPMSDPDTETWTVSDTGNSDITAAGWIGLLVAADADWDILAIGIGTNGDAAPTENPTDTTAPTLSNATGTKTGASTATGAVTTNEANGTIYAVATTSATKPSGAQVKAGQTDTGATAAWSDDVAVSSTGEKTFSVTGLAPSTTYYLRFMHEDASANQSDVASSSSFTTDTPDTTAPTLTDPTASATGATTASGTVDTNEANGTLYYRATVNTSEADTTVKAGSSKSVTTTGEQSVSITGLDSGASYYIHYLHRDSSGNESAVASSSQITTPEEIVIRDDYERSSVNLTGSSVSGIGDDAVITIKPRIQETEAIGGTRWLEPSARVDNVKDIRPTFKFIDYAATAANGKYHGAPWATTRKPMFSYDRESWHYFASVTVNAPDITFRHDAAFTQDTVYVSRSRQLSVAQVGEWLDDMAVAYPSIFGPAQSAIDFTPTLTTLPGQSFIADEFSAQTNELGAAIPATPFYAAKIGSGSALAILSCGVHAGEDHSDYVYQSTVEYLCGSSTEAQALRQRYTILLYPMVNAPGRAGGGWRGSFTQGPGGEDDLNRHFSESDTTLEIIDIPKAVILSDVGSATPSWALDFHGVFNLSWGMYQGDSVVEDYRNRVAAATGYTISDMGEFTSDALGLWYGTELGATLATVVEFGDPSPITDEQIQTYAQGAVETLYDMSEDKDLPWDWPVPIALAFSDTAPATLLTVQVWSKVPKKADVEGLY